MKKLICLIVLMVIVAGCSTDADIASKNLSKAADMFEINRRVVFYNGITDRYILVIEGKCSVEFHEKKFVVTVKVGPEKFYKHYLGRADNVFPFVEQIESAKVDDYRYRVIFKPETIIPDIDFRKSK